MRRDRGVAVGGGTVGGGGGDVGVLRGKTAGMNLSLGPCFGRGGGGGGSRRGWSCAVGAARSVLLAPRRRRLLAVGLMLPVYFAQGAEPSEAQPAGFRKRETCWT